MQPAEVSRNVYLFIYLQLLRLLLSATIHHSHPNSHGGYFGTALGLALGFSVVFSLLGLVPWPFLWFFLTWPPSFSPIGTPSPPLLLSHWNSHFFPIWHAPLFFSLLMTGHQQGRAWFLFCALTFWSPQHSIRCLDSGRVLVHKNHRPSSPSSTVTQDCFIIRNVLLRRFLLPPYVRPSH